MGSGFAKKKKQRQAFEQQFAKLQEEMQKAEYEGSAGNGLVKVVLRGDKNLKSIKIDPKCIDPEDAEALEDLVFSAFQEATDKVEADGDMGGTINPTDLFS